MHSSAAFKFSTRILTGVLAVALLAAPADLAQTAEETPVAEAPAVAPIEAPGQPVHIAQAQNSPETPQLQVEDSHTAATRGDLLETERQMDLRIRNVESQVHNLKEQVEKLEGQVLRSEDHIRAEIREIRQTMRENFRWLLAVIIVMFGLLQLSAFITRPRANGKKSAAP